MDNNSPLISVIVPIYNVEKYLPACIDSILAQSYKNLEIILVDDGSPDNCGKICDEYAEKDSRIKVIHKENGGISSARNAALDIASGDYIGFVDGDDSIHEIMYEELYSAITKTGAEISVCGFRKHSQNESPWLNTNVPDADTIELSPQDALRETLKASVFGAYVFCKLYSRKLVADIIFEPNFAICEDIPYTAEAIMRAHKVAYIPKQLYNYLQRPGSALHSGFDEKFFTYYLAHLKVIESAKKHALLHDELVNIQSRTVLCCLMMAHDLRLEKKRPKKFSRRIKQNIRKHISRESLALLNHSHQKQARILSISFTAFRLFIDIGVFKKNLLKRKGGSYEL